jgi:hypothetical protein
MSKVVTVKTTIQNNDYELSPKQIEMWTTLSKKVCKAYKYYQGKMDELLPMAEQIANDFDYI